LRELNLSFNQFKALPEKIEGMSKVEKLDLSNNQLEQASDFKHLSKTLKFLNLTNNPLPEADKKKVQKALSKTKIDW
jgi:Leucine-rich repeat (LRR) protein